MSCCRTGNETGGLDLEEQREKRFAGKLPDFLAGVVCGLAEGAFWIWGLGLIFFFVTV